MRNGCEAWLRLLQAAGRRRRPPVAAVLLVLDGEADPVPRTWRTYVDRHGTTAFCPYRVVAELARAARGVRAGEASSLAVALAMPEFDAWLLAGIEGLRGVRLSDGRGVVGADADIDGLDVEHRRDAEGPLRRHVPGYSEVLDQGLLAGHLDLTLAHERSRSFRRFRSAVAELASAVRGGRPTTTPPTSARRNSGIIGTALVPLA